MFVLRVWGMQYIVELILNVTVIGVRFWWSVIYRGTDTECYCVCFEGLGNAI